MIALPKVAAYASLAASALAAVAQLTAIIPVETANIIITLSAGVAAFSRALPAPAAVRFPGWFGALAALLTSLSALGIGGASGMWIAIAGVIFTTFADSVVGEENIS
jgi:hypothetical protein